MIGSHSPRSIIWGGGWGIVSFHTMMLKLSFLNMPLVVCVCMCVCVCVCVCVCCVCVGQRSTHGIRGLNLADQA